MTSYFNDVNDSIHREVGYVNGPDNKVVALFYRKEKNSKYNRLDQCLFFDYISSMCAINCLCQFVDLAEYTAGRGFIDNWRQVNNIERITIVTERADEVTIERQHYGGNSRIIKTFNKGQYFSLVNNIVLLLLFFLFYSNYFYWNIHRVHQLCVKL